MNFVFPEREDNRLLRETAAPFLPATLGETLEASIADPTLRPAELIGTQMELAEGSERARSTADVLSEGRQRQQDIGVPEPESDVAARSIDLDQVSPEEAEERFGLELDKPTSRRVVEILGEQKREETIRKDIIARGPRGVFPSVARFGVSFAGAAIDPLNIAAAFVPVVSQARYAGFVARFGATRGRLAAGAIEGAVGNAIIEPVVGGLAAEQQLDYTMADALANVAFGGILGGGLHVGLGRVGDAIARRSAEAREVALRSAIAQAARGDRIDVDPVFRSEFDVLNPDRVFADDTAIRSAPPPPREFDAGNPVGRGRGEVFPNYTIIGPQERRFVEGIVAELKNTDSGGRTFIEVDGQGSTPEVRGFAASTPKFFQDHNLAVVAERDRIKKIKRANRKLPDDQKISVPKTPQILTRKKVEAVANKMLQQRSLRREEVDIARFLFDVAREQRLENVRQMLDARTVRDIERRREIDAIAEREGAEIARDQAQLERDATADFEAADRASEITRTKGAETDPNKLQEETDFLREQVDALQEAGVLTERDLRALNDIDAFVERSEAYGRATRAAALCLSRRS